MPWSMRVAHQVDQRIADLLEHGLVELGLLAGHLQLDLLAEPLAEIAHQPREAVEHEADGQHAHAHDALLQRAHVAFELRERAAQFAGLAAFERRGKLAQHRLRDHKLADRIQQLVDLLDADADRSAVRTGRARGSFSLGMCRRLIVRRPRRRRWRRLGRRRSTDRGNRFRRGIRLAADAFDRQFAFAFGPLENAFDRRARRDRR